VETGGLEKARIVAGNPIVRGMLLGDVVSEDLMGLLGMWEMVKWSSVEDASGIKWESYREAKVWSGVDDTTSISVERTDICTEDGICVSST
jgi:hypothetical protein